MRQRLYLLTKLFIVTVAIFTVQKPLFMLYHLNAHPEVGVADFCKVMLHALPLDLTTAGYLTVVPWLAILVSWFVVKPTDHYYPHRNTQPQRWWLRNVLAAYYLLVSILLSLIFVADTVLYTFWGFKIDSTVFAYTDKPADVAASVSTLFLIAVIAVIIVFAILYTLLFVRILLPKRVLQRPLTRWSSLVMLPIGALLFLAIRGGVGEGTANVSNAYYSDNQFLNHSAVNPAFNIVYSLMHQQDFSKQCRFMDDDERQTLIHDIYPKLSTHTTADSIAPHPVDTLLSTTRPNILMIVWEGLGASMVKPLGGQSNVTPNLNRIAADGVLFTQCYANSFRTDRGLVSIMSGWPAMPSASLMKLPNKCNNLPGIARSLAQAGYTTDFWYGGDITFTNMGGYMLANGFQSTHSDTDFSTTDRNYSKWGVIDGIMLDTLASVLTAKHTSQPWFTTVLTLSSHEPWEVPYTRISDKKQNAFAYTDECVGSFINTLENLPLWSNLLVVIVPDHGVVANDTDSRSSLSVIRIPIVLAGGALAKTQHTISTIMNQSDLAATLLAQLHIDHTAFSFSRDILSTGYRNPTAVHTSPIDVTFIDSTGITTYDLSGHQPTFSTDTVASPHRIRKAKAILQTLYDQAASL